MALPALWPFRRHRYEGFHYVELPFVTAIEAQGYFGEAKQLPSFDESTIDIAASTATFRFRNPDDAMLFRLKC